MTDTANQHFATALDAWIKREQLTDQQAASCLGLTFFRLQQILVGNYVPKPEDVTAILEKIAHKG